MEEYEIPFDYSHDQQHFRLLELPPPLLNLIASKDPPPLQLKSAAPSQSSSVQTASDAVICTQDETFEVRQVHSSNVLYILQVSRYATDDTFDASYYEGMTAIAQCKGLLELVKASPLAEQYLKVHVPTYQLEGGSMPSATHIRTRLELLDDAPFSNGEFQNACTQLCIFEIEGNPWLPTASVLKNIWTSFLSAAIVKDIDITKAFQAVTLVTLVEEDGHIGSALQAILQRIALVSKDSINDMMLIDCEKCIKWLGSLLVEISGQLPVQRTSFVEEWQDLLPEAWRKHANLAKLQVVYTELEGGKIAFIGQHSNSKESITPVHASISSRSKWHDRFRKSSTGKND